MHEISLVRNIFRSLESTLSPAELPLVSVINLKIGQLANVEPVLLQNAFAAVTSTEALHFAQAKLAVELVPITIFCAECNLTSPVEHYRFACAHCGQPNKEVVTGLELLISGVEFQETAPVSSPVPPN